MVSCTWACIYILLRSKIASNVSGHCKLVRLTIRNFPRQNNRLNSRQKFGLNFSLQGREGRGFLVAISIVGLAFSRAPDYFRSFEGWMFLCKIYASRGRFDFLGINIKWTLHQATLLMKSEVLPDVEWTISSADEVKSEVWLCGK